MGSGDAVPRQPDEGARLCRAEAVLGAELGLIDRRRIRGWFLCQRSGAGGFAIVSLSFFSSFLNREGPSLHGLTEHGVRPLFRQLRSTQIAHSPLREVLTLPQRCLGRHGFREPVLRERTPGLLAYNIHGWLRH